MPAAAIRAAAAFAFTSIAGVAAAQDAPALLSRAEALAEDAARYADAHGLPADEAVRRLEAQEASVAATDALADRYRERLAGISIEHYPEYRIVVLLTGAAPVADQSIVAAGMRVPVVFRTGAEANRDQVVSAIRKHGATIRTGLRTAQGMGFDPRTGALTVMLRSPDAERASVQEIERRIEELTGVPVQVRAVDGFAANAVSGGGRIEGADAVTGRRNYCTTGFVVTDGSRTGIVTAAHCPDAPLYLDPAGDRVELEFGGQWGWSYQDVQLHVTDRAQRPLFYADTAKTRLRSVTGARERRSTRAGDVVCHRGESSGYSCAEVELTDFAPPGDLCGGPCDAVWVAVAGPGCRAGDSGGPVFTGTTAFGILKGATMGRDGRCAFYFYMSTDYLPDGWSLLREGSAAGALGRPEVGSGERPSGEVEPLEDEARVDDPDADEVPSRR